MRVPLQDSSTPVLFKNRAFFFLVVKAGFEVNPPNHVSREKKSTYEVHYEGILITMFSGEIIVNLSSMNSTLHMNDTKNRYTFKC